MTSECSPNDRRTAVSACYDLAEYLDASYRLAVQNTKTVVRPTVELLRHRLEHPERANDEGKERRLAHLIAEVRGDVGYPTDAEEWDDDSGEPLGHELTELVSEAMA